jgi:hypothetical protein
MCANLQDFPYAQGIGRMLQSCNIVVINVKPGNLKGTDIICRRVDPHPDRFPCRAGWGFFFGSRSVPGSASHPVLARGASRYMASEKPHFWQIRPEAGHPVLSVSAKPIRTQESLFT